MAKCIECKNAKHIAVSWFCNASARTKRLVRSEVNIDLPCREYKSNNKNNTELLEKCGFEL